MPNEIAKIETPDAQYYAADEKPTLEARVYELEKQISGLNTAKAYQMLGQIVGQKSKCGLA